jgi:hypothetical protein
MAFSNRGADEVFASCSGVAAAVKWARFLKEPT